MSIGNVLIIEYIDQGLGGMDKRTYGWIHDDGPHRFTIFQKACHYMESKLRYFLIMIYGAQDAHGLRVQASC